MKIIQNKIFDEERALYNLKDARVINCAFEGIKDGESALKEARNIEVSESKFHLRYPLWHVKFLSITNSSFYETSRAPLWYCIDGKIINTSLNSIKAIRECKNIEINNSSISSSEFGWKSNNISIINSKLNAEYAFLDSSNITLNNTSFKGKYSFQYVKDLVIENCVLDTKDAFWHSENVVVKNSILIGEYLGWYSKNITLIDCEIRGTQPLCYVENLKIINCKMINTDLAFEYSSVEAYINGSIDSIKNPRSGYIEVDDIKEYINEDSIYESTCIIKIRDKN